MSNRISREYLANPHADGDWFQRLVDSKAVDLRGNSVITDLGNGFSRIAAIDETKLFVREDDK